MVELKFCPKCGSNRLKEKPLISVIAVQCESCGFQFDYAMAQLQSTPQLSESTKIDLDRAIEIFEAYLREGRSGDIRNYNFLFTTLVLLKAQKQIILMLEEKKLCT